MSDDRPLCQKCHQPSDLGNLCRACYREWSRALWADIPDWQNEIIGIAKALNRLPEDEREVVAANVLKKPEAGVAARSSERLLEVCRHTLTGPFAENLVNKCQAILDAATRRRSKVPGRRNGGIDE